MAFSSTAVCPQLQEEVGSLAQLSAWSFGPLSNDKIINIFSLVSYVIWRRKDPKEQLNYITALTTIFSIKRAVQLFLYLFDRNVLLKQKPDPSDLLWHVMHTSVKNQ